MCSDKTDEDNAVLLAQRDDETIFVAFDIENDPITAHKTCVTINVFDVVGSFPFCALDIVIPRLQCLLGVRMLLPKLS